MLDVVLAVDRDLAVGGGRGVLLGVPGDALDGLHDDIGVGRHGAAGAGAAATTGAETEQPEGEEGGGEAGLHGRRF